MPVAAFTAVLPHPSDPSVLLVPPTVELLARATAAGVPTVQAWGYPALLPIGDAARLLADMEADSVDNAAAADLRTTYREVRDATKVLAALGRDLARKKRDKAAAEAHNATLPARREEAIALKRAQGDWSTKNPDEGLPSHEAFLAAAKKKREA